MKIVITITVIVNTITIIVITPLLRLRLRLRYVNFFLHSTVFIQEETELRVRK